MARRSWAAFFCLVLTLTIGRAQTSSPKPQAPDIAGDWTGNWSTYNPAQGAVPAKGICKGLDCKVDYKTASGKRRSKEIAGGPTST